MEENKKLQEEFYAAISHELNTPLNMIYSTVQLMERHLDLEDLNENREKIAQYVRVIKQACYRFSKIIENTTNLHEIGTGSIAIRLSVVDIVHLIKETAQAVQTHIGEETYKIRFHSDSETKLVSVDVGKIRKAILELLSNAIKYSPSGSHIDITVEDRNDWFTVSVQDEGVGIEEDQLETIFYPYFKQDRSFSRMAEGRGIGLSLAKEIVELHGGAISVTSKKGKGSVFTVLLPVNLTPNSEEAPKESKQLSELIEIEFSDIYLSRERS